MIKKTLSANIEGTASGFTAVITAETIDRDGEVLIPAGMNSKEFDLNPVLFWNHDYGKPVGKAVKLRRRDRDIVGDFVFAKRPENYTGEFFPDVAAALVGQGIVTGISVGYVSEQNGMRRATDIDRKKYGDSAHTVYSRWKLLEISLAPLQSNPDALITAVRKGILSPLAVKRFFNIDMPKRTTIVVEIPFAGSTQKAVAPIDVKAIVQQEIARRRGALYG